MTNDKIKKALKHCGNYEDSCRLCPYGKYDFVRCYDKIKLDALNLIIKQEEEIKQLKTECALLDDELRIARQTKIDVLNELKEKIQKTRLNDDTAEIIIDMIEELKK